MTTRIYNDWRPETRSLINKLKKAGFALESCDNGESEEPYEFHSGDPKFLEELLACDEAWLTISRDGFRFSLFLVLGNSPGEIVNDWRCSNAAWESQANKDLEAVTSAHYDQWIDRKQPTLTEAEYREYLNLPPRA